jgi:hypothetical protein
VKLQLVFEGRVAINELPCFGALRRLATTSLGLVFVRRSKPIAGAGFVSGRHFVTATANRSRAVVL